MKHSLLNPGSKIGHSSGSFPYPEDEFVQTAIHALQPNGGTYTTWGKDQEIGRE